MTDHVLTLVLAIALCYLWLKRKQIVVALKAAWENWRTG